MAVLLPLAVRGQSASLMTPTQLAAAAVERLKAVSEDSKNYVSDGDINDYSEDAKGKRFFKFTSHYEMVVVDGVPFNRSATINGKRLSPKELAGRNRDVEVRIDKIQAIIDAGAAPEVSRLSDVLTPEFENRVFGHESIDGHDCIVLDSTQTAAETEPRKQVLYRFWIDAESLHVLKVTQQTLADYDPGQLYSGRMSSIILLKGTTTTETFHLVDGVPLLYEWVQDSFSRGKLDNRFAHSHLAGTSTNYKRFRATMTLEPATPVEPSAAPRH
jgi:hypothetical protein